jgi:hypothetical protein
VILRYLQEVRPRVSRREVLLTTRAPFRPLNSAATGQVVRARLHALGLSLPHYWSRTLRYACASHLLEEGLSLKEIGDHIGYQHDPWVHTHGPREPAPRRGFGSGRSPVKLQHMVDCYVSYRQALGDRFTSAARDLRAFTRFIGPTADLTAVRPKRVKLFFEGSRRGV